jgi:hypothetical protein
LSVLGGGTRPSRLKRKKVLAVAISVLFVVGVGCGEGEGVSAGATVTAYVEAPLCVGAKRELARAGGRAGSVRVRVVCLADADDGGRLDLATVGANARRATEDSATVAYVETPASPSFSRPIVEAANIPVIRDTSGAAAMAHLLSAIRDARSGPSSLRDSVREALTNT